MDAADIITQGAAAAAFAKILVDFVKMSPVYSPPALLPILGLLFGELAAFLLAATNADLVFTRSVIAITVLVGISAAAGAMGITAAQNQANK